MKLRFLNISRYLINNLSFNNHNVFPRYIDKWNLVYDSEQLLLWIDMFVLKNMKFITYILHFYYDFIRASESNTSSRKNIYKTRPERR